MKREQIARVAHEINRAYCASLGDSTQLAWEDAPDWQRNSAMAGVDMHLANPDATPEQSHTSWLEQKTAEGWAYGDAKDVENKLHPCFLPYDELPPEQKAKDYLFRGVVHALKGIPDSDEVVARSSQALGVATLPADVPADHVAVRYTGRREEWSDNLYGTGLYFVQDQTRRLPVEIARKLLRHADLFESGVIEGVVEASATTEPATDDTAELLEQGKQQQQAVEKQQFEVQAIYDQIDRMGKEGLIEFAKTNYRQDLSKRESVATLRDQVRQFVDQFGIV